MADKSYHQQTSAQLAAALATRDKDILLRTVPCYMMLLAVRELNRQGEKIRADMDHNLEVGSYAPMSGLDVLSVSRLAKRTDEIALNILKDVSPNNAHDMLLATSYLMARLVEEGHIKDVTSQAVLIAMALIEEAREEPEHWNYNDKTVARLANNMLTRCMIYGLV